LTHSSQFPSKATGKDIWCSGFCGPAFSGEIGSDLTAMYEPFNDDKTCYSNGNQDGYSIPLVGQINQLTNKINGSFSIK
jgi:hypothetical protein